MASMISHGWAKSAWWAWLCGEDHLWLPGNIRRWKSLRGVVLRWSFGASDLQGGIASSCTAVRYAFSFWWSQTIPRGSSDWPDPNSTFFWISSLIFFEHFESNFQMPHHHNFRILALFCCLDLFGHLATSGHLAVWVHLGSTSHV